MQLSKYILRKAINAGICNEWAVKIAATENVDDLLKMYVSGIDFCLKNNFPSNEDLETLGGSKLNDYGIYLDSVVQLSNPEFVVMLGKCMAEIKISDYAVSQLFLKNDTTAEINLGGTSFTIIDCFDNSRLNLMATGYSKVLINIYGNAVLNYKSEENAVIKVVTKNKPTYS